jgi:hypothetical protein
MNSTPMHPRPLLFPVNVSVGLLGSLLVEQGVMVDDTMCTNPCIIMVVVHGMTL